MEQIVASIAAEVSGCLVVPVKRQLGYLFNYRTNIEDLSQKEARKKAGVLLKSMELANLRGDANINRIGYGDGWCGKSTLVKQVAEQANQEKLFEKVVNVSVLQTPDLERIQRNLADWLGMKFEEESEQGRAARLHQRMKAEKTILIILDDLGPNLSWRN
ncbi:hypothetical protein CK203_110790 [Vitis vinifera]|uniref:NB-ARC domain-containing protein n=1 Tax=Vitis vinifera TaxID=29760 RepID=A0A438FE63_VITVI|nr:hypothetical protein CK203_110790 [Vitis vinifera]